MLTVKTTELELRDAWIDSDSGNGRVHVNFAINEHNGGRDGGVVYFELEPGEYLPTHTDSPEEILYIVAGTAEAHAGDERGIVSAGDLAVIPATVPHGLRNVGDETVKVVGFFTESHIVSEFEETLQPAGATRLEMGAQAAVEV